LVIEDDLRPNASGYTGELIGLGELSQEPEFPGVHKVRSLNVRPEDLCYVMYTSGSTGRPKGVQIEHRNVSSLVLAERQIYGVGEQDRVCQAASLGFDLSVEEVWMAFSTGATLVVSPQNVHRGGTGFEEFLIENRVTVLTCVPTLLSMLND